MIHHSISAGLLDGEKHRVVGPQGSPELDAADDQQKQHRYSNTGLDRGGALFRAASRWPAADHCRRISVADVNVAGNTGHGRSGAAA